MRCSGQSCGMRKGSWLSCGDFLQARKASSRRDGVLLRSSGGGPRNSSSAWGSGQCSGRDDGAGGQWRNEAPVISRKAIRVEATCWHGSPDLSSRLDAWFQVDGTGRMKGFG